MHYETSIKDENNEISHPSNVMYPPKRKNSKGQILQIDDEPMLSLYVPNDDHIKDEENHDDYYPDTTMTSPRYTEEYIPIPSHTRLGEHLTGPVITHQRQHHPGYDRRFSMFGSGLNQNENQDQNQSSSPIYQQSEKSISKSSRSEKLTTQMSGKSFIGSFKESIATPRRDRDRDSTKAMDSPPPAVRRPSELLPKPFDEEQGGESPLIAGTIKLIGEKTLKRPSFSFIDDMETNDPIHAEFYITSLRNVEDFHRAHIDPINQPYLRFGRPNLPNIFERVAKLCEKENISRVAVVTCGPPAMVDDVVMLSRNRINGVSFDCHHEVFEF